MKRYLSSTVVFALVLVFTPSALFAHSGLVNSASTVEHWVVPKININSSVVNLSVQNNNAAATGGVLKPGIVAKQEVSLLQAFLYNQRVYFGSIDGVYGPQTKDAVKAFQKTTAGKLTADGVAGPKTIEYIASLTETTNTADTQNISVDTKNNIQKISIPSLPKNVLARALKPSSGLVKDDSEVANKITSKPKASFAGFSKVGIYNVVASGVSSNGNGLNGLNTNFEQSGGSVTSKYVCGTKDGVKQCFLLSADEAAQVASGTLDLDSVLAARSGGSTQIGSCPSVYVDENGATSLTDQSWWNNSNCGDANNQLFLAGDTICVDGMKFNLKNHMSIGVSCSDGVKTNTNELSSKDDGEQACLQGLNFNPITGAACGAIPNGVPATVKSPLFCETGAVFDPVTGKRCLADAKIEPGSFRNNLAAYAMDSLIPFTKGQSNKNVDIVQRVLANYGFLEPKNQTGFAGSLTEQAVSKFQKSVGVKETGTVDEDTISYIKAAIAADTTLKSFNKVSDKITQTDAANKISNLLDKYPTGVKTSSKKLESSAVGSGQTSTSFESAVFESALNPTDGGAGTSNDIGQVFCKRITSTAFAPNMYSVKVIIGTDKIFWVKDTTPTLKYKIPNVSGPFPTMKIVSGSGMNGIYFSYVEKDNDGIPTESIPSLFVDENMDITMELANANKIFTLSPDGTKYYSFDWSKLNDPNLPKCAMPSYGNGFIGVIGPDGLVHGLGGNGSIVTKQCSDGIDNDGDAKVDYPSDPGCSSNIDNSENSDSSSGGGGTTLDTSSCFDGIQNQNETGIDTGGVCINTDNDPSGSINTGNNKLVNNSGQPCPTNIPCHEIGLRRSGSYPINLVVEDFTTDPDFKTALQRAVASWNLSPRFHIEIVPGTGPKPLEYEPGDGLYYCNRGSGSSIPICEFNYGTTAGWVGAASINPGLNGGGISMNTPIFNMNGYSSKRKKWANLVVCQELGHELGINHRDAVFGNSPNTTCQDYDNEPDGKENPDTVDMLLLEKVIYPATYNQSISNMSTVIDSALKQIKSNPPQNKFIPSEVAYIPSVGKSVITHFEKLLGTVNGVEYKQSRHFMYIPETLK